MLSCKEISHLSSDYIDNNLSLSKRLQMKMHLFMCKKCRSFVKQMRLTIDSLKQMTPTADEALIDQQVKVLLKVNAEQVAKADKQNRI